MTPKHDDAEWSGALEPRSSRRLRTAATVAVVILAAAGVLSIVQMVGRAVGAGESTSAGGAPPVPTLQLSGLAEQAAVDYLAWDENDRPRRQVALARYVPPGSDYTIDGWDGVGRQRADASSVVGFARESPTAGIVTVRVRVTPFTKDTAAAGSPAPTTAGGNGPAVASGPDPAATGWTEGLPRWLNLAVPVEAKSGGTWVSTTPALVGSPATSVLPPATAGAADDDSNTATATKESVTNLLGLYAASDLAYARADGATFDGLGQVAELKQLSSWRAAPATDPSKRAGDADVTWALDGGGTLSSQYRLDLSIQNGKTYLASISALRKEPTS